MDLIALKQWELQRKYESLTVEFTAWKQMAEQGQPLEKHHRQVHRLANELEGMLTVTAGEVEKLRQAQGDKSAFFTLFPRAEYLILEVHRTWQFFREKLMSRQGPPFAGLLEALDEFVWSCYYLLFSERPEPPLVFFSSEWSPIASSRRAQLPIMPSANAVAARYTQMLAGSRLAHMVIPVVSLPWYTTAFLPLALLLAHETGHLVEYDLDLKQPLVDNLRAATIDETRLEHRWLPWRAEVFADLYGVLTVGPAYVGALHLLLSRSKQDVLYTPDPTGDYPPLHLRLRIALSALAHLGFATEANDIKARWDSLYGNPDDYLFVECEADVEKVIAAMWEQPLAPLPGGKALRHIDGLPWTKSLQEDADKLVQRLLQPYGLKLENTHPRVVLASTQLAFEQGPEHFAPGSLRADATEAKVVQQILAGRESGKRAPGLPPREKAFQQAETVEALSDSDRDRGSRLAQAVLAEWDRDKQTSSGIRSVDFQILSK